MRSHRAVLQRLIIGLLAAGCVVTLSAETARTVPATANVVTASLDQTMREDISNSGIGNLNISKDARHDIGTYQGVVIEASNVIAKQFSRFSDLKDHLTVEVGRLAQVFPNENPSAPSSGSYVWLQGEIKYIHEQWNGNPVNFNWTKPDQMDVENWLNGKTSSIVPYGARVDSKVLYVRKKLYAATHPSTKPAPIGSSNDEIRSELLKDFHASDEVDRSYQKAVDNLLPAHASAPAR